jgi:NADPH-dependent 2,4-dienoyl-CoA reductase/sulfur reductase-like enzyme
MKVVIVGGVAGGASCAARLRRLDEKAEIIMVERGPYVSYANCGLPYHIGDVIEKESSLLVATENTFRSQFAVDARTNCEAIKISPDRKTIDLRNVKTGEVTTESYDKLVLSPGAVTVRPPLPGIDLPGIFQVRTVPDARAVREWLAVPRRDGQILRLPDGEAQDARGGHRGRVHRPRDGGEPRSSRV